MASKIPWQQPFVKVNSYIRGKSIKQENNGSVLTSTNYVRHIREQL